MAGENLIDAGDYSARRYAEFFDSLPMPIFRTTIEGKIVYCNYAFADLFGFESALDLIDYPVIEFYLNKKDRGSLIHTVMKTGRINELPVALKKKDGTPIWCAITAKAILDDDGIAINLDGVLKEITSDIDTDTQMPEIEGQVVAAGIRFIRGEKDEGLVGALLKLHFGHGWSHPFDIAAESVLEEILARSVKSLFFGQGGSRDERIPGHFVDFFVIHTPVMGAHDGDVITRMTDIRIDDEVLGVFLDITIDFR